MYTIHEGNLVLLLLYRSNSVI